MSTYDDYPGITEDQYGIRANVKVAGRQVGKRFKRGTPLKTITDWQDRTRVALREHTIPVPKGQLAADTARYLTHQKVQLVPSSYASLVCELNAWLEPFGQLTRDAITREMVLEQRRRWLTEPRGGPTARKGTREAQPHAPKTCNHRLRALAGLYHFLDGSRAPTPCDDVPKLREPEADPKFVSVATVKAVVARLADPKTRARFMVLVSSGQRPAQLKRATPEDVDLARGVWLVRPAKGGKAIPVILTDDMLVAFTAFAAADAWGDFDGSDYAKALYTAGWPRGIRPYNAKHTVAITLGEAGVGWEDMRDWFGHKDVKTTRIYAGHILARTRATAQHLEGRIGWTDSGTDSPAPGLTAASPKSPAPETDSRTDSRQRPDGTRLVKNRRNLAEAKTDPAVRHSGGKA
jgi:integrase